jgi:uncharacterized integral membrane protein
MSSEERGEGRRGEAGDRSLVARVLVAAAIVAVVIWFAVANSQRVEVDYLVASRDSRLVYVIVGSAILGAVADRLVQRRRRRDR